MLSSLALLQSGSYLNCNSFEFPVLEIIEIPRYKQTHKRRHTQILLETVITEIILMKRDGKA